MTILEFRSCKMFWSLLSFGHLYEKFWSGVVVKRCDICETYSYTKVRSFSVVSANALYKTRQVSHQRESILQKLAVF